MEEAMKSKTGYRAKYCHVYVTQGGLNAFLLQFGHKIKTVNSESSLRIKFIAQWKRTKKWS